MHWKGTSTMNDRIIITLEPGTPIYAALVIKLINHRFQQNGLPLIDPNNVNLIYERQRAISTSYPFDFMTSLTSKLSFELYPRPSTQVKYIVEISPHTPQSNKNTKINLEDVVSIIPLYIQRNFEINTSNLREALNFFTTTPVEKIYTDAEWDSLLEPFIAKDNLDKILIYQKPKNRRLQLAHIQLVNNKNFPNQITVKQGHTQHEEKIHQDGWTTSHHLRVPMPILVSKKDNEEYTQTLTNCQQHQYIENVSAIFSKLSNRHNKLPYCTANQKSYSYETTHHFTRTEFKQLLIPAGTKTTYWFHSSIQSEKNQLTLTFDTQLLTHPRWDTLLLQNALFKKTNIESLIDKRIEIQRANLGFPQHPAVKEYHSTGDEVNLYKAVKFKDYYSHQTDLPDDTTILYKIDASNSKNPSKLCITSAKYSDVLRPFDEPHHTIVSEAYLRLDKRNQPLDRVSLTPNQRGRFEGILEVKLLCLNCGQSSAVSKFDLSTLNQKK